MPFSRPNEDRVNRPASNPMARDTPVLLNTAGEVEAEIKSRRHNLIEGFSMLMAILVCLWWVAYPFGVLMGVGVADALSRLALWAGAIFVLLVSPRMHGDTPESRGLGNPMWVWRALAHGAPLRRLGLALLLGGLTLCLAMFLYANAPDAGKFLLGLPREIALAAKLNAGGSVLLFIFCLGVSAFWTVVVIRYDNFISALTVAGKMLSVLLPVILIFAFLCNGPAPFGAIDLRECGLSGVGYIFWGAIQQLLFCGYFGTRLRKGFAPGDRGNRRVRRLSVAILNGSFFGLIHINSWSLVVATWILGTFLSWAFMEDRARNLFALGIVHGVLGTCTSCFFNGAHGFHIRMRVGPWWMSEFDPMTAAVSSIVIVGLAVFLYRIARARSPEDDPSCCAAKSSG